MAAIATSLAGSQFEIDNDANLINDAANPLTLDWANVAESRQADAPSGSGDNSFGNGTKEDSPVPSIVDGSIPPNKSDLTHFGVYLETTAGRRFLNVFWRRVQDPTGTTNMDFEFNQSSTLSANGVTPVRTEGDLLIQYDLANGGTNPELFLSRWRATGAGSLCQASNSTPCWGTRVSLSAAGNATGSINTTAISAANSDGLGATSARTFGEAQIDFDALTGGTGTCASFGSAYLKSRSSDSFSAALKDFIAPVATNINNCATVIIRKQTDPEENPNSTNFDYTKAFTTQPASANTFTLQDDGVKTFTGVLQGTGLTVSEDTPPAGWELVNVDCSASTGVTPSINGATVTFSLDSAADILDCTYTNRARGSIVVEKITDDGQGAFDFTSGTLTPSPFTLTTTGSGAAGKDSRTFSDLAPGTYDVAETVPAGWNLASSSCDDGSNPSSIDLGAGETVTCTFHDQRETGAILITKTRKHAAAANPGSDPHAGVDFTVTGGELAPAGTTVTTDANGEACVDGLVLSSFVGDYTVTEDVPANYVSDDAEQDVTVSAESTCGDGNEATVDFHNTPLTDVTVSVDSLVDGGTRSTIDCDTGVPDAGPGGDVSTTGEDLQPGTYTCTVVVDP